MPTSQDPSVPETIGAKGLYALTVDINQLGIDRSVDTLVIKNIYVDVDDAHIRVVPFEYVGKVSQASVVINLPATSTGSVYEFQIYDSGDLLASAYFKMPGSDCLLSDLSLYTAYPQPVEYPVGPSGLDAYEISVKEGLFEGTRLQWIDSQKVTIGDVALDADIETIKNFAVKPAGFKVARRIASTIDTLQYYLDRFNSNKSTIESYISTIPNTVDDAITEAVISSGFVTLDSFELGATIAQRNEALRHTLDGKLYRWAGNLPKTVPIGSTPITSGGIGANAWLEVSDTVLRMELSSAGGATKIGNAKIVFANVNAMSSASWVKVGDKVSTLSYHDSLGYGGGEYVAVATGTGVADGFEYINGVGVQFKLDLKGQCDVTQAGARGINDSAAIMAAANIAKVRKIPLIAPTIGKLYQLNTAIDLMGIYTVHFLENINTSLVTDAIAVTVGGMANSGVPDIKFQSLFNGKGFTQPTPALPVLRVFGAKSGTFEIGACNYVQIYADAAVAIGNSTAYNRLN